MQTVRKVSEKVEKNDVSETLTRNRFHTSVRKILTSKAEKFKLAAAHRTRMKTKRFPTQVKKKNQRAPTFQEEAINELKKLKLASGEQIKLTKGPILDSAATVAIFSTKDSKKCDKIIKLPTPILMDTIDGETKSTVKVETSLPLKDITNAVVLDNAGESVVPTFDICDDELAYYQDKQGAAIYNTETKEVFECPQDGKVYRMPLTKNKMVNRQEVHVAEIALAKERTLRKAMHMLKHQARGHKPRMPIGMCHVCDEVRVLHNPEHQPQVGEKLDQIKAQADLVELRDKDINGDLYVLTVTTQHGIKAAVACKTKSTKDLYKAVVAAISKVRLSLIHI